MLRTGLFALFLSSGLAVSVTAQAALLNGSYSYDANSGLYTYDYTLDNSAGTGHITVLSILISDEYDFSLQPDSSTSPTGWSLDTATGGDCDTIGCGTFFQWNTLGSLPPGDTLSGFSFTTAHAPSTHNPNNYGVFSDGDYVEYGYIVAPDIEGTTPPAVPLPAAVVLLSSGLMGLLAVGTGRRKRST